MEMSPRLEQSMKLLIAPKMIQSMEILQLPVMALVEKIQAELEENPVLEEVRDPRLQDEGEGDDVPPPAEVEFNPDAPLKHDNSGDAEFNRLDELNKDWDEYFDADHRPSRAGAEGTVNLIPDSRIFRFARTSRCASVASGTTKAAAISRVVSPATKRKVSATRASGPRRPDISGAAMP